MGAGAGRYSLDFAVRLLSLSIASQELVDAQLEVLGFIDLKIEFRNVPHAHTFQQFVADEATGCG